MKTFLYPSDLGNLESALQEAKMVKNDHYCFEKLGRHRTALLIFFLIAVILRLLFPRM